MFVSTSIEESHVAIWSSAMQTTIPRRYHRYTSPTALTLDRFCDQNYRRLYQNGIEYPATGPENRSFISSYLEHLEKADSTLIVINAKGATDPFGFQFMYQSVCYMAYAELKAGRWDRERFFMYVPYSAPEALINENASSRQFYAWGPVTNRQTAGSINQGLRFAAAHLYYNRILLTSVDDPQGLLRELSIDPVAVDFLIDLEVSKASEQLAVGATLRH